jgi:hypothetical protein
MLQRSCVGAHIDPGWDPLPIVPFASFDPHPSVPDPNASRPNVTAEQPPNP